jgi:hypothetical protein
VLPWEMAPNVSNENIAVTLLLSAIRWASSISKNTLDTADEDVGVCSECCADTQQLARNQSPKRERILLLKQSAAMMILGALLPSSVNEVNQNQSKQFENRYKSVKTCTIGCAEYSFDSATCCDVQNQENFVSGPSGTQGVALVT